MVHTSGRPQAWEQDLKFGHLYQSSESNVSPSNSMKPQKVAIQEVDVQSTFGMTWNPLAPLAELWAMLRVLGIIPYVFDKTLNLYVLRWRSVSGVLGIMIAIYLSVATVAGTVGIIMTLSSQSTFHSTEQEVNFIWQMMVVVLFGSMLLNAWSQTVSLLMAGNRLIRLLNSWLCLSQWCDISSAKGIKTRVRLQMAFMIGSCISILALVLAGFPQVVLEGLDGVASILFLVPSTWMHYSSLQTQVIRILTCVMCLHFFCVYNGCLFFFTTICYMLRNALATWNTQLAMTFEDLWCRNTSGGLASLVHSHHRLVSLVRETDEVFGFLLQVYYASTVVTLCTEIYLLAYRMCCGEEISINGLVTTAIIFLHTAALFLAVSLAAASVYEVAEESTDGLRLGLPYEASDVDKFHRDELTSVLTLPTACITGGKFFVINRPLIITIVSAVITYFIVIVQFMQQDFNGHTMDKGESTGHENTTDYHARHMM